jgi:hypothetical protein
LQRSFLFTEFNQGKRRPYRLRKLDITAVAGTTDCDYEYAFPGYFVNFDPKYWFASKLCDSFNNRIARRYGRVIPPAIRQPELLVVDWLPRPAQHHHALLIIVNAKG